ncbi:hypothetical protein ACEWY4_008638 [Coilia grayii]|uniref:Uncharacterized protein n=1 Tax=Coilia grayii TaxID=363190 RepID=A0ABD1KBF2_9TELE
MAERETQRAVYRSVSFKKLGSWGTNKIRSGAGDQHHISKDLESGALPPSAPETAAEKAQPSATRSVTVSRKVSKISAASLSTAELKKGTPHSISPSIRQLSEKFRAKTGLTHGAAFVSTGTVRSTTLPRSKNKEDESPLNFSAEERTFLPTYNKDVEDHFSEKSHEEKYSTQESVSGSDSDRSQTRLSRKSVDGSSGGKRDYSHIARYSDNINHTTLNADDDGFITEAPACKSHRSYISTHGDSIHADSSNWPSVTKIRELFGDRKQHRSTDDAEDLKSSSHHYSSSSREASYLSDRSDRQSPSQPRGAWLDTRSSDPDISESSTEHYSASLSQKVETFKIEPCFGTTTHPYDSEFTSGLSNLLSAEELPDISEVQSPCRGGESRTEKLDGDPPRPFPPAPPPRSSSVARPLRAQPLACTQQQQQQLKELKEQRQGAEQPQPPDSLHSSHSSFRPQAAPSVAPASARWRFSSGEEEYDSEGRSCTGGGRSALPLPYARGGGGGSGGAGTYFSSRSKNDNRAQLAGRSSGSEEDSSAALAHSRDNIRRRSLRKKKKSSCSRDDGESDDSDEQPVMMMDQLERHQQPVDPQQPGRRFEGPRTRPCFTAWERGGASPSPASTLRQEGFRRFYRGAADGTASSSSPSGTPPVPVVSRVSKVNLPSFLSSPCGSRSSSRYSSTETLKEEDQPPCASSSVMSKTYHGNFTMYRSPSFGHGDNFSRAPVRVVPRVVPSLSPGDVAASPSDSSSRGLRHSLSSEKERNRISMSNPDIASETMSLLSYLKKTDLSGLKVGKKGRGGQETGVDGVPSGFHTVSGASSSVYRMGSRTHGTHSGRPSLKDLTATLRRAKSFTYSEKTPGQRYSPSGPASRSSSEQRLDCQGDGERIVVSDREVESDDCCTGYSYEEPMPSPLHDRYVQEARQVIQDICQMGAGEDDDFGFGGDDSKSKVKCDAEPEIKKENEVVSETLSEDVQDKVIESESRGEETCSESEKCLQKGNSEENVFYDKSLGELSGHESSLTDEGIVTEPEAGLSSGPSSGKDLLGQTLTVWSQSALYNEELPELAKDKSVSSPLPNVRTEYEAVTIGSETSCVKNANPNQLEAPSTPSAIRRRRKFSSAGNNGSDSSNGSNGESNGESAYRSLSDPMPHRRRSVVEDGNTFSVDSNLLGSLTAKVGGGSRQESSVADLSECTGSAASDLSVCSDSLRDYSTVIESIVREPGTMDKVIDEKGNGKAVKKKSFSDPSRRGEPTMLLPDGQAQPSEPIRELEQPIPPSSSEPILSEQREELWAPEGGGEQRPARPGGERHRSQSENALPSHLEQNGEAVLPADGGPPCFTFDPKLAEVLSPRVGRRSPRKRPNRAPQQQQRGADPERLEEQAEGEADEEPPEENPDLAASLPQLPPPKARPGHVRHASEPATFVPIIPPEAALPSPRQQAVSLSAPAPLRPHKQVLGDEAPSLEDVTKRYILNSSEGGSSDTPPVPAAGTSSGASRSTPATPTTTTTTTDTQRKNSEELSPAPIKAKPRVEALQGDEVIAFMLLQMRFSADIRQEECALSSPEWLHNGRGPPRRMGVYERGEAAIVVRAESDSSTERFKFSATRRHDMASVTVEYVAPDGGGLCGSGPLMEVVYVEAPDGGGLYDSGLLMQVRCGPEHPCEECSGGPRGEERRGEHRRGEERSAQERRGEHSGGPGGEERRGEHSGGPGGEERRGEHSGGPGGEERRGEESTVEGREESTGEERRAQERSGEHRRGAESTGEESTGEESTGEERRGEERRGEESTGEESTGEESTGEERRGEESTVEGREERRAQESSEPLLY